MRCLELDIFGLCGHRCLFCSAPRRSDGRPARLAEIARVLAAMRLEGFRHATFTGGEPTLHPRFAQALRLARRLGYRTRAVSNGEAFSRPGFAARILPELDELCLSIHGDRPEVHDRLTGKPGSFSSLRKALEALAAAPSPPLVAVNAVATRLNLDSIPALARLVCRPPVRQFWVSSLIPEGDGLARYHELAVPYESVLRRAPDVLAAARAGGASVRFFGFPACVLGPHRPWAADLYKHPARAFGPRGPGRALEAMPEEAPPKLRSPRCRACVRATDCGGVWRRYLERFGDAELAALS